jgi:hypothetical protein
MEVFSSPLQRNGAMWCITRHPTLEGAREPHEAHGRRRGRAAAAEVERGGWLGAADPEHSASASTSTSPTHQPTRGSFCNRPLRRNFFMCCRLPANKGVSGVAQHQHQHHSQHAPAAPACRPHPLPLPGHPLAGGGDRESRGGRRGRAPPGGRSPGGGVNRLRARASSPCYLYVGPLPSR